MDSSEMASITLFTTSSMCTLGKLFPTGASFPISVSSTRAGNTALTRMLPLNSPANEAVSPRRPAFSAAYTAVPGLVKPVKDKMDATFKMVGFSSCCLAIFVKGLMAHLVRIIGAVRLVAMVLEMADSEERAKREFWAMPAQLMRIDDLSRASRNNCWFFGFSVLTTSKRSSRTISWDWLSAVANSLTVSDKSDSFLATRVTLAPNSASFLLTLRPMPLEAPVTMALLPVNKDMSAVVDRVAHYFEG